MVGKLGQRIAADCVSAGHKRRARRGALHLHVKVGQTKSLVRQPVEARRRSAANDPAAVEAGLAPTEVVHENQDDVGLLLCPHRSGAGEAQQHASTDSPDTATLNHSVLLTFLASAHQAQRRADLRRAKDR